MQVWILAALLVSSAVSVCRADDDDVNEASVTHEDMRPTEEVIYVVPDIDPKVYFADHFDDGTFESKWVKSVSKKEGAEAGIDRYDGEWAIEPADTNPLGGDYGLVLKSKAKHAAVSSRLKKPFVFDNEPFIIQYVINYQSGQECGGGYLKLYSQSNDLDLHKVTDKTPYTIMFGPDRCGSESKLHFIFRHVNPKNKTVEEKHCKKLETKERAAFEELFKDHRPHLFRLVIGPDNSFEVSIDYKVVNHGSLLNDFSPAVNPPAEIDDPSDRKPADWDEREKIADPDASKPDDWDEDAPRQIPDDSAVKPDGWLDDEPETVPDPEAARPDDWDDEMDGDWEPPAVENSKCKEAAGCGPWMRPSIDNPAFKGKWRAPMIDNPNYKGKWKPRRIPNPDYFLDPEPFKMAAIGAVGIELWSMSDQIYFDDVVITSDVALADAWARSTFDLRVQKIDAHNAGLFRRILNYSNKNPWLYAVYVVVVGLPLVLIITFCCSGDGSSAAEEAAKKDPKKTDEVQEDDVGAAAAEEEEDDAAGDEAPTPEKPDGGGARKRKARKE